ncbi:MAG: glycosyltransferase, partial [Clostridia bacterium]|nr:glycosyltransferase [Clostridia bacterium]
MKKILFVLPWLKLGGLERVQVNIANALAERGYDVTVMTLSPENDLQAELSDKVKYVYKPYKPHPFAKKIPYIRNKFYDDGMWETRATPEKLYKYYVGDEKYDVEVGFFRGLSIKIISGSTNKNSLKLAWVHNDFKVCGGITNNFKSLGDARRAYGKYDKIICVSDKAKESFEQVIGYADKTTRIYNLLPIQKIVDLSNEVCEEKKEGFTIVSVGHLTYQKGYDKLINAVVKLNDEGERVNLWLVGFGEDENRLKALAQGKDYIKFLGKQVNPYKYMKQADLYVCSSRYEGFNLTVAEALIVGAPVMSTDCTGPTEILDGGKYGKICENSEDGIYNGIKALISDKKTLEFYRSHAEERGDFFGEKNVIDKIIELL